MKTLKHLFTALLLMVATVAKAHDFEVDGICYNILSEEKKTVKVTFRGVFSDSYYNEYTGSVDIPSSVISNGITYAVTSIGERAFQNCFGLTSITIPNSVTSIGDCAFDGCTGLTSITIPGSVTTIGQYAFYGCTGLTSITIPNSVTSIGERAFQNCFGLTSITIPNSVTNIEGGAFQGCTELTNIVVDEGNSVYDSRDNCNAIIKTATNRLIAGCRNTVIPGSVTTIGESAFQNCFGLTSITIPNSVTSIGNRAFSGCSGLSTGLTSVVIGNSVTSIGNYAFDNCTWIKTVVNFSNLTFTKGSSDYGYIAYYADNVYNAPNGSIEDDYIFGKPNEVNTLLGYLGSATELTLPGDYKGEDYIIGWGAFSGCSGLTSITIPGCVTSIGERAFYDCTGLTSITIPNSVTSIEAYVFYGCTGLTSIEIPNSVTSIGNSAFSGCTGLTRVDIVDGVKSIGYSAFAGCSNLEELYISNTIESIADCAFKDCTNILEIKVGSKKAITCNENIFSKDVYNNALLYVPEGRKFAYEKTVPWNRFYIVETDFTDISGVKEQIAESKTVYDLQGRKVDNPTNGIYIVNGKKTFLK